MNNSVNDETTIPLGRGLQYAYEIMDSVSNRPIEIQIAIAFEAGLSIGKAERGKAA